ncbi:hypothetical protein GCM10010112_07430 [Actinoplanes lobatus]|uniref:Uncharacterized protein n=1 Tax=Actinoplanes lobatus TaxID=113568 RepID=A0A7W7MET4_9ACTN|nr:hypothetical protein [Actinoplanes lobatus]MBB4747165.1 hypothetical protein [Actinoplanes lobatus]GGN56009.1 hypothetical protein GCM10010112_07430 [Actinoplanes lobatus]GIE39269.1 hypothetical protein Alo02nite_21670 [Actinoplanes lobatus]
MSYQVFDTYDGIDKAMRMMRDAMKGMPERHRYMRHYDDLRRSVAVLLILLEEATPWLDETSRAEQSTSRAKTLLDSIR